MPNIAYFAMQQRDARFGRHRRDTGSPLKSIRSITCAEVLAGDGQRRVPGVVARRHLLRVITPSISTFGMPLTVTMMITRIIGIEEAGRQTALSAAVELLRERERQLEAAALSGARW